MNSRRHILLCGNSVILGSICACLQCNTQIEVTKLASPLAKSLTHSTKKPDVLLFDLETPNIEPVFSLLKNDPTVLLIGISSDTNLVKIWSGQEFRDLSMNELFDLIGITKV